MRAFQGENCGPSCAENLTSNCVGLQKTNNWNRTESEFEKKYTNYRKMRHFLRIKKSAKDGKRIVLSSDPNLLDTY